MFIIAVILLRCTAAAAPPQFWSAGDDVSGRSYSFEQADSSRWHLSMEVIVPALEKGHLALDTNVLLSFHRAPDPRMRQKMFKTFHGMRANLVIPHQVELEYHLHRKRIREAHRRQVDESLLRVKRHFDSISGELMRESRYSQGEEEELRRQTTALSRSRHGVMDFLAARSLAHRYGSTVAIVEADIEARVQRLIAGKITPVPTVTQEKAWKDDVRKRHEDKRPPGWAPEREGGGNERRGDCFIWQQLIEFAQEASDQRPIVLVTEDRKPTGWFEHRDKIPIGANLKLVDEMHSKAGVKFVAIGMHHVLQYASSRTTTPRSRESAWLEEHLDNGLDPVRTRLIADHDDGVL